MKKRMTSKLGARILAFAVSIALVLGAAPLSARAVSGHSHDGMTAISNVTELENLFTNGGSGYLTGNIECSSYIVIPSGKSVELCFNGHLLLLRQHLVLNGSLTLDDCDTTSLHYFSQDQQSVWTYQSDTTATEYYITGGGITTSGDTLIDETNSYATGYGDGGAIYCHTGSSLTLHGGNLVGNRTSSGGGAVYVKGADFFMDGGEIAHNYSGYSGGGVYVGDTATIYLVGGEISHNYAGSEGGGVFMYDNYCNAHVVVGGDVKIVESHAGSEANLYNVSNLCTHWRPVRISSVYEPTSQMKVGLSVVMNTIYSEGKTYTAVGQGTDTVTIENCREITEADMAYFSSDSDFCQMVYDSENKQINLECIVKILEEPSDSNDYSYVVESDVEDYEDDLSANWYAYQPVHQLATADYIDTSWVTFSNGTMTATWNEYYKQYQLYFRFWSLDQIYLTFADGYPSGNNLSSISYTESTEYEKTICMPYLEDSYAYYDIRANELFSCQVSMDVDAPVLQTDKTSLYLTDAKSGDTYHSTIQYKDTEIYTRSYTLSQDSLKSVSLTLEAQSYVSDETGIAYVLPENSYGEFTVSYRVNDSWQTTVPTAVGSYDVKITRAKDATYAPYRQVLEKGLVITEAPDRYYQEVTTVAGEIQNITGSEAAKAETNPLGASIENAESLETLAQVTAAEKAEGVNVWVEVVDASETISTSDKAKVDSALEDETLGMYLDVSLFKKVGSKEPTKLTTTTGEITIGFVVPTSLRKEGRSYKIMRLHGEETTLLDAEYEEETNVLTFQTDRFSTYAIVYTDTPSSNDGSSKTNSDGSTNKNKSSSGSNTSNQTSQTSTSSTETAATSNSASQGTSVESPKTGSTNTWAFYLSLLWLGLAAGLAALVRAGRENRLEDSQ